MFALRGGVHNTNGETIEMVLDTGNALPEELAPEFSGGDNFFTTHDRADSGIIKPIAQFVIFFQIFSFYDGVHFVGKHQAGDSIRLEGECIP